MLFCKIWDGKWAVTDLADFSNIRYMSFRLADDVVWKILDGKWAVTDLADFSQICYMSFRLADDVVV